MKATLVTGDPFDYIELQAEDLKDCCALYRIGSSTFPRQPERISLFATPVPTYDPGFILRIRVSDVTPHAASGEINAAHDAEN